MGSFIPTVGGIPLPYFADNIQNADTDEHRGGFIYFDDNLTETDVVGIPIGNSSAVTVSYATAEKIIWKQLTSYGSGAKICLLKG